MAKNNEHIQEVARALVARMLSRSASKVEEGDRKLWIEMIAEELEEVAYSENPEECEHGIGLNSRCHGCLQEESVS